MIRELQRRKFTEVGGYQGMQWWFSTELGVARPHLRHDSFRDFSDGDLHIRHDRATDDVVLFVQFPVVLPIRGAA